MKMTYRFIIEMDVDSFELGVAEANKITGFYFKNPKEILPEVCIELDPEVDFKYTA